MSVKIKVQDKYLCVGTLIVVKIIITADIITLKFMILIFVEGISSVIVAMCV